MAESQVDNMDIVAHASAVRGRIVVAADVEALELADGDLSDIGHEVAGDSVGILADAPALVRADGIEVAEDGHAPLAVGYTQILKYLLDEILRRAVGIRGASGRHILSERRGVLAAVNSGGRAEDELLASRLIHHAAQADRARYVVVIVVERLFDALRDALETRKVNDRVDLVLGENFGHRLFVAYIRLIEFEILARKFFYSFKAFGLAVDKIIEYNDIISRVEQLYARVRADEARAAGY